MFSAANLKKMESWDGYLGPAIVASELTDGSLFMVELPEDNDAKRCRARLGFIPVKPISKGDEVLVIGHTDTSLYIIGQMNTSPLAANSKQEVVLKDGTKATIDDAENPSRVALSSKDGKLLCRYDAEKAEMEIGTDMENIRISAPRGDMEFSTGGRLSLKGHAIDMSSNSNIRMAIGNVFSKLRTSISLTPGKLNMNSQDVSVVGKKATFTSERMEVETKDYLNKAEKIHTITDKLEIAANTIMEKTINRYDRIEGVHQKIAGRFRAIVENTFHLKSRHTIIKAEEDVKVKSEKIHLG